MQPQTTEPTVQPIAGRSNFPLYFACREQLSMLDDDERGRLMMAVMDYAEFGTEPSDLSKLEKMAFASMRFALDRDLTTYQQKVEAGRANGKRGGRPRKDAAAAPAEAAEPAEEPAPAEAPTEAAEPADAPAPAEPSAPIVGANQCVRPQGLHETTVAPPVGAVIDRPQGLHETTAPETEGIFLEPKKPNPFLKTPTTTAAATPTSTPTSTAAATSTPTPTSTTAATSAATPTSTTAATSAATALPVGSGLEADAAAATTVLLFWKNNLGTALPAHVAQCMAEYKQQGCTDDIILYALERMIEAGSKNFLYARKILDEACQFRLFTRADFIRNKGSGYGGANTPVTRTLPTAGSGNQFLENGMTRPRRLKRKE